MVESRLEAAQSPDGGLHNYEPVESVLVSYPSRPSHKPVPKWYGPLAVLEVDGDMITCQDLRTLKCILFHRDRPKLSNAKQVEEPVTVEAVDADEFIVETTQPMGNFCRQEDIICCVKKISD